MKESDETPKMEAMSHSKGFLKSAVKMKKAAAAGKMSKSSSARKMK